MAIQLLAILGGGLLVGSFMQSAMHFYPPLWTAWQKRAFESYPNVNPAVIELIEMYWRGEIDESEYLLRCSQFGYDNQIAQSLYRISENLLSVADYITLWRRGKLSEDETDNLLHKMHLTTGEVQRAKQATEYFPNPNDLIRFAVREVYSPEIIQKFGMTEDLPDKFISEAAKGGLTKEHATQFWQSHWELPSANMGFEMLHRRIINEDELKLLLRALDVMPFWRDALVKLSYNPLTRVDVRRMYGLGVLDEEGVNNAYLDVGYSPENALKMTEFTVLYESDEYTGLTRGSVIAAFKKDIVTAEQLKKYLVEFGYSEGVVEFWLAIAESEKESDAIDVLVDEIKAQYYAGLLTMEQVRNELSANDLPATFITSVLNELRIKRSAKIKQPTRSDLETWLSLQLINDVQYSNRMLLLGYEHMDIEIYLTQISLDIDTTKVKYMPLKTYIRWFTTGIITEERFRSVLTAQGYNQFDVNKTVSEAHAQITA